MEKKSIIRCENLRKIYRIGDEKVVALNNINLDILQGQICCIVGTSGSGKSTLLNQLAGLEKPTKGCVYIGKTNISTLNENQLATFRQRYLGFVFQSYNLLPTMTAMENVALPLEFKGYPKSKRNKIAMKMLENVGLKKRARHKPTEMSGGQQQRVGIARAFVSNPKVIFADEPTGNLDTKTTIDVMQTMVGFARKYNETLIIVTHDPELADYADRVITLIDGNITNDYTHVPIFEREGYVPVPRLSETKEEAPSEKTNSPSLPQENSAPKQEEGALPLEEETGKISVEIPVESFSETQDAAENPKPQEDGFCFEIQEEIPSDHVEI